VARGGLLHTHTHTHTHIFTFKYVSDLNIGTDFVLENNGIRGRTFSLIVRPDVRENVILRFVCVRVRGGANKYCYRVVL